jgi:VIT1/CCC1 family predicted Fe2+/Mn2+ transporter
MIRPFVLSANDGLVSIAALMAGFEGASADLETLRITAVLGAIAGALSMAVGEYVSVSAAVDMGQSLESPLSAAGVSLLSFLVGAVVPILSGSFVRDNTMRPFTVFFGTVVGLFVVGYMSSTTWKVVAGGVVALAVSYAIGSYIRKVQLMSNSEPQKVWDHQ